MQLSDNFVGQKVCVECGWIGPASKAQQQAYPCKIYKTVEMEISVLMSMWDTFRPEKAPTLAPVASDMEVWIDQALDFFVTKGFLPIAHYKLIPEADATPTS